MKINSVENMHPPATTNKYNKSRIHAHYNQFTRYVTIIVVWWTQNTLAYSTWIFWWQRCNVAITD